jgi:hypothetical protein
LFWYHPGHCVAAILAAAVKSEAEQPNMVKLSRKALTEGLKDSSIADIVGVSIASQLTTKQKTFAMEVAKGATKASAYRKAYKQDASKRTLAGAPYELANDPRISREIKAYELAIEASKHRTPAALRELVISGLVEIALNTDTKDAVRVQALRTLGTVTEVSAFTERKEVRTISSSETAKASILAQLQTLMSGDVTDVTSRDAESLLAELRTPDATHDAPEADPPTGGEAADGSGVPSL